MKENKTNINEILGFDKIQATDEDIIRIAKSLGCESNEVLVCRVYIKEYYYRSRNKDATLN